MCCQVNDRLGNAVAELKAKYESGHKSVETSIDGPSGEAYKKAEAERQKQRKEAKKRIAAEEGQEEAAPVVEDETEDGGDESYELRMLREKRLKELASAHKQKAENIGRGHGQYREIVENEFLAEVTNSDKVICHFYHRDFARCQIMHHHLRKLAPQHIEAKFININAEKAPFFVEKLKVRMMPTLVYFVNGVATGKQVGFEGLSDGMPIGKEDEWPTILLARSLVRNGMINESAIVDEEGTVLDMQSKMDEMRRKVMSSNIDDFSDDDS
jgi:hypothetical protein